MSEVRLAGLLLAAGAGSRLGTPKALLRDSDGTARTLTVSRDLLAAGCGSVTVVLGAAADQARALLAADAASGAGGAASGAPEVVVATGWAEGLAASLRIGLQHLPRRASWHAALVMLVDLPDVREPVLRRVVEQWRADGSRTQALLRATYAGRPGHPVLLGRDHWADLTEGLAGDEGAQAYLRRHKVRGVRCEDLATGRDVDRPADLVDPPTGPERP